MDFKRNILLIDLEMTGLNPNKHEIIQLAAVLLDKKTLKEKKHFSSYVKPAKWHSRDPKSMAVNKISLDTLKSAPSLKLVIKKFNKTFGHNVIQAFYVGFNDKRFLLDAYERAGVKYAFDYHYFDLWPLFFGHLGLKNQLKSKKDFSGFGLEYLIKKLKINVDKNQLHDALVDCRVEAEVLRKIMSRM